MLLFLATIHHETDSFKRLTENLNYSVDGLIKTFSRKRISIEDCRKYGRFGKQKADQKMIANIVYGGEYGRKNLGNILADDGWNFRGRTAIHLTGRANYKRYSDYSGVDFIKDPDKINNIKYVLDVAGWFWSEKNINRYADINDVASVRKLVNGGSNGLESVRALTEKYFKLLTNTIES